MAIPFDFSQSIQLSKDKQKSLSEVFETWSDLLSARLPLLLQSTCDTSLASFERERFDDYLKELSSPTTLHLLEAPPLPGQFILEVNAPLAYAVIDKLLGQRVGEMRTARQLTELELAILKKFTQEILQELEKAFARYTAITWLDIESISNPSFIRTIPTHATCFIATIKVRLEELSGLITFCCPASNLLPIQNTFSRAQATAHTSYDDVKETLKPLDVEIKASLTELELTMEEILGLDEGDVIDLGMPIRDTISVEIGGTKKISANPGIVGTKRGFRVQDWLS